jgi:hypothetical protein
MNIIVIYVSWAHGCLKIWNDTVHPAGCRENEGSPLNIKNIKIRIYHSIPRSFSAPYPLIDIESL